MKRRIVIVILGAVIVFCSCKKDHGVLGVEEQPASDALNANYSDTAQVFAHTIKYDSTGSVNDRNKFLGSIQDPVFGRTDVNLYTNISIKNNETGIGFGVDPNLTGAEIILALADIEASGNFTSTLTYSVFALNTSLDINRIYYTNVKGGYNTSAVLAVHSGSIEILNGKYVLRIPVDMNYAASILGNTQYLVNNEVFQATYKGFYITSSGSDLNPVNKVGFTGKYNLDDDVSGFYLYYQNGTPSPSKEYKSYQFTFSGSLAVRFNSVNYDPGSIPNANLFDQVMNGDSAKGKYNLFVKGLGGTKLKVYIPSIKNYSDSFPVSANRAEVVFNVDPSFTTTAGSFPYPPKFALLPINENSQETFAIDQTTTVDLSRYGGSFDAEKNQVVFNIVREVQAILRGTQKNRGFYLVMADPTPIYTARRDNFDRRVVFAGWGNALLKPKFNFSFIKLAHDK